MVFTATTIAGVHLIGLEPIEDDRGGFARTFCRDEFARHGLRTCVAQCNISYNRHSGTLRGMHYQAAPHEEAKVVSCLRGALYDVIVDLRPDSPTYCRWLAVELSAERARLKTALRMLYVPEGCAHGFQTLEDDTVVSYQMSESYHPGHAKGVRWDDPILGILWPLPVTRISTQDRSHTDFRP